VPKASVIRTSASALDCVNCHDRLGGKILPVRVPEDNGDGMGKTETWCPPCFVGIRAVRDARWQQAVHVGQVLAIQCLAPACGVTSVDFGRKCCGQCGSRKFLVVLPKGTVLNARKLQRWAAGQL
jgi:hypothetical protein